MKESYDFSNGIKNPYAKRLKKQITIRLDPETIDYFKSIGVHNNIPYQSLINLYLKDCANNRKKLKMQWA